MKALAPGGRGKWKDYVDLYYLIRYHIPTRQICNRASELFADSFNPLLFFKQLGYFKDINYTEEADYVPGFEVSEAEVKAFLTEAVLTGF